MFSHLKKYFVTGILILIPLLLTVYILVWLFGFVDGIFGRFINAYLKQIIGFYIPGLGLIFFFSIIVFAGFMTTHFLGKRLYLILDRMLTHFPLIRHIYPSLKQILEFLFSQEKPGFKKAVLVEYPRKGMWSMGFITNQAFVEAKEKTNEDLLNVFVPSSPGPLTGYFVLVRRAEVIFLDISIEDALKMIISGGLLNPALPSDKG